MNILIILALWFATGGFSFILLQYLIDGWDYVIKQQNLKSSLISAVILGPITSLFCCYTLFKFYISGGKK